MGSFALAVVHDAGLASWSLWSPGEANVITQGAVMAFESQEHMTTDGVAGPKVWQALLQAAATDQVDEQPGTTTGRDVSTSLPEHVTRLARRAARCTRPAPTPVSRRRRRSSVPGPCSVRLHVHHHAGTNPDGSHYSDPGVPWVSYFHGGDALHGFIRPGYGYPQSLGCVEMPPANAEVVYPYTPIGTLVTVE